MHLVSTDGPIPYGKVSVLIKIVKAYHMMSKKYDL